MWKALFFLACVASVDVVISTDDKPAATPTAPAPEPTYKPRCDCGEYPPKCGKNEVYNNCSDPGCGPHLCSELGFPLKCDKKCKPGCICKAGYLRDEHGRCIPTRSCPSCGGDPNAESGCGNNCGRTCATYKQKPVVCPLGCILNGCNCREGFVYDPNVKACVRPKDCTPTCKKNEVYSFCINGGCGPKNCSEIGKPDICVDPVKCIKGCVCAKGYLRHSNGTCVPTDQCKPPTCPKGEVWDTCPTVPCEGDFCPLNWDSPQTCPVGIVCDKPRCVCGHKRKRDYKTGKCIPITDCPPTCKKNEVYSSCVNGGCEHKNCSQLGKPKLCVDPVKCMEGCVCAKGYLRHSNGTCVPTDQCKPPTCPKGEVWDTCPTVPCEGDYCPKTWDSPQTCPVGIVCDKPRCVCEHKRKRDYKTGKCILITDCPPTCKKNEVYSTCVNGGCGPKNCSQLGQPDICVDPVKCIEGCVCAKGYLRHSNGTCVPTDQCPPPTCPKGEVWDTCPTVPCEGDYCPKTRDSPQTCPVGIVCDKPRCVCGYNRKRDYKTGKCILITDCPPFKCGRYEEYQACPSNCPGEKCSESSNKTKCPVYKIGIIVNCKPACKCIKRYCRNADGKCVPEACECAADYPVKKP